MRLLAAASVALTAAAVSASDGLSPETAIERGTVGLALAAAVVLTMLILQRLWTLPRSTGGRVVHGIQVAVLALALLNTAGLYLLTRSDDGSERYALMVQKYQRVSAYAGFMLIQIPSAYLLSVMMRYVLRAQSSTLWTAATASADELQERASDGVRAAGRALAGALAEALSGSDARDLAESVRALAEAVRIAKADLGGSGLQRMNL